MKNLVLIFIALVSFANTAFSQSKGIAKNTETTKVIAMVNTANWCPACKANGTRVEENVISHYMTNSKCQIVVNDLSDAKTKTISKGGCEKAGIMRVASNNTGTGTIFSINSTTKKVISQISITKTDVEIKKAFEDAIKTI